MISVQVSAGDLQSVTLEQQVRETEQAFARTMAERDFTGFKAFLSEEAIFLSGDKPLRGKEIVAARWQGFFQEPDAPFSWRPETVVVLESGSVALSTGPVFDQNGKQISAFTSTWRLEEPGVWRIVFDKGDKVCQPDG